MIQLRLFDEDVVEQRPTIATLPEEGIDLYAALRRYQSSMIDQALTRTNGNRAQAARLLRLKRTTLVMMLRAQKALQPSLPVDERSNDSKEHYSEKNGSREHRLDSRE